MAIFNYTLPSGSTYKLTAPTGTTQAQADSIFYSQVAAGTFVGYKKGDTLTHPKEAIENFGISRLARGTAGVDDKTIIALISGLPIVVSLPSSLTNTTIQNPIDQTNYIQVISNPTQGTFSLPPVAIGGNASPIDSVKTQALMAQLASVVNQSPNTLTQEKGLGKYGFNAQQLEWAGYIKPGYADRYSRLEGGYKNPSSFVSFMNSPAGWTGLNGVTTANDLLDDEATQNQIQQQLMQQSYNQLVSTGTIVPATPTVTTPPVSTGQVYSSSGILTSATALGLISAAANPSAVTGLYNSVLSAIGLSNVSTSGSITDITNALPSSITSILPNIGNTFSSLTTNALGSIPDSISNLGTEATALFNSGLSSLSSGAVGFANSVSSEISGGLTQLSGLASGVTGAFTNAASAITSTVSADIGALVTNASVFGTDITNAWASTTSSLTSIGGDIAGSLSDVGSSLTSSLGSLGDIGSNLTGSLGDIGSSLGSIGDLSSLSSSLDILGKSSQFSIGFADFSLSSLVSSVQAAPGFTNTVDRSTLDAAAVRVIGSPLITPPSYDLPSASSLGLSADIAQAKSILASAGSAASSIGSQVANIGTLFG